MTFYFCNIRKKNTQIWSTSNKSP